MKCLRDEDENLQGPCSAGSCKWPDCTAVAAATERRCIWCEAKEGDHGAPICSGPDGRGHHFRKTPWVTPNVEFSGGAPLHGAASAGTQG